MIIKNHAYVFGVKDMKKLLALNIIILVAICLPDSGICQASNTYDLGLGSIKEKISSQLEKIKATREYTDNQIALAKNRVDDEILRSEEKLALQLESLDLLKQDLQTQSLASESSIQKMSSELSSFSKGAMRDIEDQIALTKSMLERLKGLRGDVYSATQKTEPSTSVAAISAPPSVTTIPTGTNNTYVEAPVAPVASGST